MVNARAGLLAAAVIVSLVSVSFGGQGTARGEESSTISSVSETVAGYPDLAPLVVTTDKTSYLPGEPVNITATFPYGYGGTFPSSMTIYYMILDSDGTVLYDMKKHVYVLWVITTWIVEPGYSRSFIWDQKDDTGKSVGSPKWLQAVVVVPAWYSQLSAYTDFEINPMPASFDLSLVPGWNLLSMPLVNESWSAGGIGLATGSIVVAWNAVKQGYSNSFVVGVSLDFLDFGLEAGCSYFVYSPQAQTIALRGCSPDFFTDFSIGLAMPSGGGWICVGFSSLATGFYASDISGFVNGAKVTMVCMWDPVSGSYDTYAPGISPPFLDFVVGPGDGCWLLLDGPATLTYSP